MGPKCPNHLVQLVRTNDPGVGICPISGAHFRYTAEDDKGKGEEKLVVDLSGKLTKKVTYKVEKIGAGAE